MVIFSLLSYFGVEQPDWQIRRAQFTSSRETAITTTRLSRPQECTPYSGVQLQGILRGANNDFADAQIIIYGGQLCLPPNSAVDAQSNALNLITPFCTISFVLEPSGGVSYWQFAESTSARKRRACVGNRPDRDSGHDKIFRNQSAKPRHAQIS
jgi:hypothetical protein